MWLSLHTRSQGYTDEDELQLRVTLDLRQMGKGLNGTGEEENPVVVGVKGFIVCVTYQLSEESSNLAVAVAVRRSLT